MRFPALGNLASVLLVLAANSANAQKQQIEVSPTPFTICELTADGRHQGSDVAPRATGGFSVSHTRYGTTFEVTYNDFPPDAEAAFQAAVDIWADHITSPTPIRINANWLPLGEGLLGSAGPFLIRSFDAAPISNTWYPAPLADALAGADLDPGNPDIEATFNSTFPDWYFGVNGNPPPNQFDLTTIVLHEIGHGLGFIGAFSVQNGVGTVGVPSNPGIPFVYDRFTEDGLGRSLLDTSVYPLESFELANVLQSEAYLGGSVVEATYGRPALLYTPSEWNDGSSYSHLDEDAFPRNNNNGLMTPFLVRAEVIRSPGPIACALMQEIGWNLRPACQALVDEPPPTPDLPDGFSLSLLGAPLLNETTFLLSVAEPQRVQVRLVNGLGRVVLRDDRFVQAGSSVSIRLNGGNLPGGVYFAQFIGETFKSTRAVINVR